MTTPSVNTERLFSKVGRFFHHSSKAITEGVQNAYRSYFPIDPTKKAPAIYVTIRKKSESESHPNSTLYDVTIEDMGRGIKDPIAMLSVCSSDWAEGLEQQMDPAGFGVFALLAFSESVVWESTFGSLHVIGEKFFNDAAYRAGLVNQIDRSNPREVGTKVKMINFRSDNSGYSYQDRVMQQITKMGNAYFTVDVFINGSRIAKDCDNTTVVYRDPDNKYVIYHDPAYNSQSSLRIYWHGHSLDYSHSLFSTATRHAVAQAANAASQYYNGVELPKDWSTFTGYIVDVIAEGQITPVLPDRDKVTQNGQLTEFLREIAAKIHTNPAPVIDRAIASHKWAELDRQLRHDALVALADHVPFACVVHAEVGRNKPATVAKTQIKGEISGIYAIETLTGCGDAPRNYEEVYLGDDEYLSDLGLYRYVRSPEYTGLKGYVVVSKSFGVVRYLRREKIVLYTTKDNDSGPFAVFAVPDTDDLYEDGSQSPVVGDNLLGMINQLTLKDLDDETQAWVDLQAAGVVCVTDSRDCDIIFHESEFDDVDDAPRILTSDLDLAERQITELQENREFDDDASRESHFEELSNYFRAAENELTGEKYYPVSLSTIMRDLRYTDLVKPITEGDYDKPHITTVTITERSDIGSNYYTVKINDQEEVTAKFND